MGFFSNLGSSLKKTLKKATSWVGDTAKTVSSEVKSGISKVVDKATPIVNTLYSDGKQGIGWAGGQVGKVTDAYTGAVKNLSGSTAGLISNVGEGVKDVGQGIGNFMPYLAVGGAVLGLGLLYTNSGKRQYSRTTSGTNKRTRYSYGL